MRRATKIANLRAMIERAGLADIVDAVYDREHMAMRAVRGEARCILGRRAADIRYF